MVNEAETLAQELLAAPPQSLGPSAWARAVAIAGRQALEAAVADWWREQPGDLARVAEANTTNQLVCLRALHPDKELAVQAHQAWALLSEAIHHHVHDLPPTGEELAAMLAVADRFGRTE